MVESSVAAKMPAPASRKLRKDDISEKDEFHLPQIVRPFAYRFSVNLLCFIFSLKKKSKSSQSTRI